MMKDLLYCLGWSSPKLLYVIYHLDREASLYTGKEKLSLVEHQLMCNFNSDSINLPGTWNL